MKAALACKIISFNKSNNGLWCSKKVETPTSDFSFLFKLLKWQPAIHLDKYFLNNILNRLKQDGDYNVFISLKQFSYVKNVVTILTRYRRADINTIGSGSICCIFDTVDCNEFSLSWIFLFSPATCLNHFKSIRDI